MLDRLHAGHPPGDTVSVKDTASGALIDSMVVQNVAGKRPVQTAPDTLEIHGTAQNKDGSRPDVAVLSSRLISPRASSRAVASATSTPRP